MERNNQTPSSPTVCRIRKVFGFGALVFGAGLVLTFWLLPIGLPVALFGLAMMTPGERC